MLTITQSQDVYRLFAHLLADLKQRNVNSELTVFEHYNLIVPSSSVKTWITNTLASSQGISAMINSKFWGSYQWQLMGDVLDAKPLNDKQISHLPKILAEGYRKNYRLVPKEPSLSVGFMQWRIFTFFQQEYEIFIKLSEKKQHLHVLYDFLKLNVDDTNIQSDNLLEQNNQVLHSYWWQVSKKIAKVFSSYLTHRPEWLAGWSEKKVNPIPIKEMVFQKNTLNRQNNQALTPEWLVDRYYHVEKWQQYIWQALFIDSFNYRAALFEYFWEVLHQTEYTNRLPKQITFFTLPPVPKADLAVIRRLATYTDILLLHYNPSQEYWADITDPFWLSKHSISQPELSRLKETGHFLLARMGKQARDTFKLLIELSGGINDLFEQVNWQDDFVDKQPLNLLQQIQSDILYLQEDGVVNWQLHKYKTSQVDENNALAEHGMPITDNSIRIHACHNITRQLEVLREEIIVWLNKSKTHKISDIVVMLPDLASHEASIRAIFPNHIGIDGFGLPAMLTGLVETETAVLWQAISQRFNLLNSRFSSVEFFDWLLLPPVFEAYGLNHEQIQRGCELLQQAGFKRGFNASHLALSIAGGDGDSRFTLRHALDRLTLGLLMPKATVFIDEADSGKSNILPESVDITAKYSVPLSEVNLHDAAVISALTAIYDDLNKTQITIKKRMSVSHWLHQVLVHDLEAHFEHCRGKQSWQEIMNAIHKLDAAHDVTFEQQNKNETTDNKTTENIGLHSCGFVLEAISEILATDMRGSEPTGAITFCRMGTIRPIPFKLVILLNMNIGEYPQYEQPNSYNLMDAGLAQVGDRQREDDETGAFLDALMMAEEACWFFYNGFSVTDTNIHLPASPLQELMLFLDSIYQKQSNALKQDDAINNNEDVKKIPQLIEHPPLPFSVENFELDTKKNKINKRGFWYEIYNALYVSNDKATKQDFINWHGDIQFPNLVNSQETVFIDGKRWINQLVKPAQHFLYSQLIANVEGDDAFDELEPLMLNKLSEYKIRETLLSDIETHDLTKNTITEQIQQFYFDDFLPAGVVKEAFYQKAQHLLQSQMDVLLLHAKEGITKTNDQVVNVANAKITAPLPTQSSTVWADIKPTNGKDHHKVKLWIMHLLWQVARNTNQAQVDNQDGISVCVYAHNMVVKFAPVLSSFAVIELKKWLAIWLYNQNKPIVLPPKWGLKAAKLLHEDKNIQDLSLSEWINGRFGADYTLDDCSLHHTWQLILAGENAYDMLLKHAHVFAALYLPIVQNEITTK